MRQCFRQFSKYISIEIALLVIAFIIVSIATDYTTLKGTLAAVSPYWGCIIALVTPVLVMHAAHTHGSEKLLTKGFGTLVLSVIASFGVMYLLPSIGFGWLNVYFLPPIFLVGGLIIVLVANSYLGRKKLITASTAPEQ